MYNHPITSSLFFEKLVTFRGETRKCCYTKITVNFELVEKKTKNAFTWATPKKEELMIVQCHVTFTFDVPRLSLTMKCLLLEIINTSGDCFWCCLINEIIKKNYKVMKWWSNYNWSCFCSLHLHRRYWKNPSFNLFRVKKQSSRKRKQIKSSFIRKAFFFIRCIKSFFLLLSSFKRIKLNIVTQFIVFLKNHSILPTMCNNVSGNPICEMD